MAKKEDTPNKGHKHLFGSSEKSDFILNMTADGAQKMCGVYIILAVIITALAAIPAYFTQTVEEYTLEDGSVHYLSENFIFYAGAAVMLLGFVGYLIFMIACSKKQVVLKDNKALFAPLAVMLLSAASCITSLNLYTAVLGNYHYTGIFRTVCGSFCCTQRKQKDKDNGSRCRHRLCAGCGGNFAGCSCDIIGNEELL